MSYPNYFYKNGYKVYNQRTSLSPRSSAFQRRKSPTNYQVIAAKPVQHTKPLTQARASSPTRGVSSSSRKKINDDLSHCSPPGLPKDKYGRYVNVI